MVYSTLPVKAFAGTLCLEIYNKERKEVNSWVRPRFMTPMDYFVNIKFVLFEYVNGFY